jgi:CRP/FNR family cyclic AMP-dependent transcriptional regulator
VKRRRYDSELGTTYEPGEAIVVEGDAGDCMYVVQSGSVEAFKAMNGEEVHLETIGPGGFFGEMALFQGQQRAATVRAVEESRVLTVDKRTLLRRMKEDPLLAYRILVDLADRVRELDDRLRAALAAGKRP